MRNKKLSFAKNLLRKIDPVASKWAIILLCFNSLRILIWFSVYNCTIKGLEDKDCMYPLIRLLGIVSQ